MRLKKIFRLMFFFLLFLNISCDNKDDIAQKQRLEKIQRENDSLEKVQDDKVKQEKLEKEKTRERKNRV